MLAIPPPMLASPGGKPFTSPKWLYEIRGTGYRCLARAGGDLPVDLRTRNGGDCTRRHLEVAQVLNALPGGSQAIDDKACLLPDSQRAAPGSVAALHDRPLLVALSRALLAPMARR